ncbi:bifunctional alpha/beta hydrolase/OsmC family protein [Aquimarina agarilytica]|uniref:bifunctional alpha/beta hydrolase/OsmC family protein n=1 Tax=Aquimarina agarilytica TaxID=1087449 RepID=UPI000288322F|nr:bifunctional alpha/beta hydrolase/OsmC family protein [Aquimarina agarilytica]
MNTQKVTFKNTTGQQLSGRLELPFNQQPHNFVLFAHCFTCNKNLSAIRNISRALAIQGFGVLRFDFTGLGESEGDFEDTNFSGNVEDLVAASNYLKTHHQSPVLLIGHSLGGAAAIFAASNISSIKAVATIGAPSNPKHVTHLLHNKIGEIIETGLANVNLGGRRFTIKKQFIDDLEEQSLPKLVHNFEKALLVLHSPQDTTVGIQNAEEIYKAAKHPKSFISLDGADHLLMRKEDSIYVGEVIAGWSKRYIKFPEKKTLKTTDEVAASLNAVDGFTTQMKIGNHHFYADEPKKVGGNDFGPNPYEFISAGLSACTAMTIQMYAKRKGWQVDNVEVHTSHSKQYNSDCENCEQDTAKIDTFIRKIKLTAPTLNSDQLNRILKIADKCPVHKTLYNKSQVITELLNS